ncbi:BTB domain-containing protein [Caenorhabditis elegans]|uniref:BTB domain-containing protein n=1 Tax=Caenorhabditis elegans TaxID=6239 RepID=H2KYV6_CAEEL|nr:BTB domain-containing protein [Caenorhabditis elegans]CCD65100.1 BTB domain-containing protein [Caenorhabditis elegans]|eukprot:NP_001256085.1 Uncharacterized protein CELE_F25E5.16 [Caenorhabditis elegans]
MGRKKEKHNAKIGEANVKKTTIMRFLIDQLDGFTDKLFVCQAEKYNWTTHFYRGQFFDEDYLIVDIYCHSSIPSWSCDARTEVKFWNTTIQDIEHHYEMKRNCMSCPPFIKWKDLISRENNYVRNGRIVCEVLISEVPKKANKNQAVIVKEYPGIRNLEILVEKSKFHVNMELLAFTSKFFEKELARGRLNTADPYILEDITPIDFKLYMDLTYHPKQYFSAYHAKDILQIAKRFNNLEVVTTCQNVILEDLNENKLSTKNKTKLAESYDLDTVRELFNPNTMTQPSARPRFMAPDKFREKQPTDAEMEGISELFAEPWDNQCHCKSKGGKENFDEKLKIKVENQTEKEEDDEDYDISMPSTSGC